MKIIPRYAILSGDEKWANIYDKPVCTVMYRGHIDDVDPLETREFGRVVHTIGKTPWKNQRLVGIPIVTFSIVWNDQEKETK